MSNRAENQGFRQVRADDLWIMGETLETEEGPLDTSEEKYLMLFSTDDQWWILDM